MLPHNAQKLAELELPHALALRALAAYEDPVLLAEPPELPSDRGFWSDYVPVARDRAQVLRHCDPAGVAHRLGAVRVEGDDVGDDGRSDAGEGNKLCGDLLQVEAAIAPRVTGGRRQ